jgi:hypothetical protein
VRKSFVSVCERINVGGVGILEYVADEAFLIGLLPLILFIELFVVIK